MSRSTKVLIAVVALAIATASTAAETRAAPGRDGVTQWRVHASMGLDAVVLIGALTGDKLQAHYFTPQVEFITGRMAPEALASLDRLAALAQESGSLVGPFLALLFSGGPTDTLDDVIASARDPEGLLRPALEASAYWRPERWPKVRDGAMPEVLTVLLALKDIGFEDYWIERVAPKVMPAVEAMAGHLAQYDIIPEQQRLLGRPLSPEIELIVLQFSLPYGIKIIGQRFIAHHSYETDVQLRIAAHEIFHPPFELGDEALLASLAPLRDDPWMRSIVEDHDPAFGYNSFEGVLNEDSAQALDQLVSERLGFARDPAERWRHADDGMHLLAAAIYDMLREDGYAQTGGVYARWLDDAIAAGRFEPAEVRRRAERVVGREAVERWGSGRGAPAAQAPSAAGSQ